MGGGKSECEEEEDSTLEGSVSISGSNDGGGGGHLTYDSSPGDGGGGRESATRIKRTLVFKASVTGSTRHPLSLICSRRKIFIWSCDVRNLI